MASFTPNDNTLSNAPHPDDIDIAPRICGYCNEYLAITDKAKSSGRYWKGCKRCLDERAAKEQKRIIFKRAKAELVGASFPTFSCQLHGGRCSYDFRTDDEQDNEETFFIKQETSSALDPSSFCKYNAGDTSDDTNLETAECTVCTLPYSTHTFLALPSCTHPPSVCSTCFIEWLTTQIPNLQPIPCPSTACTTFLSHTGIHTHAPLPLFTRYDDLTMRSLLSSDPSFLYCLNPSCTSGQIHDSEEITDPQTPAYKGCEEHFQDPVDRKKDGNWYVNCITCRNKAKAIRRREKAAYGMCFGQKKNHASQGNIHDEEPGSEDAL
ncbi:hypothetical protein A1F94_008226 [Pyrenophora tritici-repentis]|nr:hypothetical protein A1F94_008226 [Pyrenophora tritici-repentis]